MRSLLKCCAFIWALTLSGTAAAQSSQWFEPQSRADITRFLETRGYAIETGDGVWVTAPDGTRVLLDIFTMPDGSIAGLRVSALFLIWDSERAHEMALFYEATTPLASIAVQTIDGERLIRLQRDVLFGSGRTPDNVAENVAILFQLIPIFQDSLADADPGLRARWTEARQ